MTRLIDHVARARDVDQRRFADRRGRGDTSAASRKAERRGAADERRTRPAPSPLRPGSPSASAIAGLRGDDPEADLPHLLGDRRHGRRRRCCATITGPEDRLEAGLQLGRQRGDLLRDIIDADEVAGRRTAPSMAMSTRRDPIRPRRRRRAARCARAVRHSAAEVGPPAVRQAVASEERDQRRDQRRRPSTAT